MAADLRNNYKGDIPTADTVLFTSPAGRRTFITGIRFINQGTLEIYAEARIDGVPVFVGITPPQDGIYDVDTRIEVLPEQSFSLYAEDEGLKYFVSVVEVDN